MANGYHHEAKGRIDRALAPINLRLLKGTTLRDVLGRYLTEVTPAKDSAYSETARLKKLLREQSFCDLALADLTPKAFADYRTTRLATVKPGTVHRELGLIRHALEVARREWDMDLPTNPLDRVQRPKPSNALDRLLGPGEYERLKVVLQRTRNPLPWLP